MEIVEKETSYSSKEYGIWEYLIDDIRIAYIRWESPGHWLNKTGKPAVTIDWSSRNDASAKDAEVFWRVLEKAIQKAKEIRAELEKGEVDGNR